MIMSQDQGYFWCCYCSSQLQMLENLSLAPLKCVCLGLTLISTYSQNYNYKFCLKYKMAETSLHNRFTPEWWFDDSI